MEIKNAVEALSSLAQETRLEIFRLLVRHGPEGMAAGEIAGKLGVPSPTLSFHLAHLTRAGLLECQRDGRSHVYRADLKGMGNLLDYLTKDCCQGRPELCGELSVASDCCATAGTAMDKPKGARHGQ